jgi:hypothetical protein
MNDDFPIAGLSLAVLASISVFFLLGVRVGFDDGLVDGKNEGIIFCMEKQKECKISYDYLKLQENQK